LSGRAGAALAGSSGVKHRKPRLDAACANQPQAAGKNSGRTGLKLAIMLSYDYYSLQKNIAP
jgi:hypothetical protein